MSDLGSIAAGWDAYYAKSTARVPFTDVTVFAVKALARNPEAAVYEFGAGNGQNIGFLKPLFPKARLIGSDISEEGVKKASELHPGVEFFVNTDTLPFEPESLDVILERGVLAQTPKDLARSYAKQFYAALKPGGQAFFEIPNTGHGHYKTLQAGGRDEVFGFRVFYTLDELKGVFSDFTFEHVYDHVRRYVEGPGTQSDRPIYDESSFQLLLSKPG